MRLVAALVLIWLSPISASAGELTFTVRTSRGAPVVDAVVTVQPASGGVAPRGYGQPLQLAQKNRMFDPFVLVVPVGARVSFPNRDPIHHQVYSFSPAKKFELKLYGQDAVPTVVFDKPGVVAVGCNIHDTMVAFIDVTTAPFAVKTDKDGRARLTDLPPGEVEAKVWHPYAKAPGEQAFSLTVPASRGLERTVVMDLRTPPIRSNAY